jgi:hypothetical protein
LVMARLAPLPEYPTEPAATKPRARKKSGG